MMTMTQLDAKLRALLNGAYAIDVQVWNHRHSSSSCTIEWSIWDVDQGEHFKGATPEEALGKLIASLPDAVESPELAAVDAHELGAKVAS